jgi:hypothetical protein
MGKREACVNFREIKQAKMLEIADREKRKPD